MTINSNLRMITALDTRVTAKGVLVLVGAEDSQCNLWRVSDEVQLVSSNIWANQVIVGSAFKRESP